MGRGQPRNTLLYLMLFLSTPQNQDVPTAPNSGKYPHPVVGDPPQKQLPTTALLLLLLLKTKKPVASTSTTSASASVSDGIVSKQRPLYGHIHIEKTAGTALNAEMANTFRGVCGHKGYSYDFYQANERVRPKGQHFKYSVQLKRPGDKIRTEL